MDHVVPRHRGGQHVWVNLVSACPSCNRHKGGKSLAQAQMRLLSQPVEPKATGRYLFHSFLDDNAEWEKFLQGWWE
jgi:5-methylcytosine-specific restriction endonuclease McrA